MESWTRFLSFAHLSDVQVVLQIESTWCHELNGDAPFHQSGKYKVKRRAPPRLWKCRAWRFHDYLAVENPDHKRTLHIYTSTPQTHVQPNRRRVKGMVGSWRGEEKLKFGTIAAEWGGLESAAITQGFPIRTPSHLPSPGWRWEPPISLIIISQPSISSSLFDHDSTEVARQDLETLPTHRVVGALFTSYNCHSGRGISVA